jgi:hypothetical protein
MNEDFLHHLWKFRLYNSIGLKTTVGEELQILKTGQHNTDGGPDFFNSQIKIGKTKWAGNVEVHLKSSDWKKHAHDKDGAYKNVILHVVYENDEDVFSSDGNKIAALELKDRFNPKIYENYLKLIESKEWIPCQKYISNVDRITITSWLERLLVERLESKTQLILDSLKLNRNNWEETFYQHLAKNFGFKTNAVPFELLVKSLQLNYLAKHKDHLLQIEALLYGQAGLLDKKFKDDYPNALKKEYAFLQKKYSLKPIDGSLWKFLRLRPGNFPTIRIAQFAQLIYKSSKLFSKILEQEDIEVIKSFFEVSTSDYWKSHFTFDKPSTNREKTLGNDSAAIIIINTIVPLIFAYGKQWQSAEHEERVLQMLEQLSPEKNSIIDNWNDLGIKAVNAADTQSLLQLKNEYCSKKKCLVCGIGSKIISQRIET